jgi:hypothetical protein
MRAITESGPWVVIRSVVNASEPLPVSDRRMASGTSSAGKPVDVTSGRRATISKSMAPEPRNIPMATRIPTRKGMIFTATSNPSFAPSMKTS